MVTATKNWYSLHPDEIVLLTLYLQSDIRSTLRDTPIFLPVKSPTVSSYYCLYFYCQLFSWLYTYDKSIRFSYIQVPFRLVTCELVNGVTLCALCGPAPSLSELKPILHKIWRPSTSLLTSLTSIQPRRFPPISLDRSILG